MTDLKSSYNFADMAELADAHGSGPCEGFFMGVRIPLSAPVVSDMFRLWGWNMSFFLYTYKKRFFFVILPRNISVKYSCKNNCKNRGKGRNKIGRKENKEKDHKEKDHKEKDHKDKAR